MTDEEVVYVASTTRNVYHTDPECPRMVNGSREAPAEAFDHLDECEYCSGEFDEEGKGPSPMVGRLKRMDPGEVP